ncbi:MAG: IS630 family transposase [Phycisphaerales bacterium]|nr:IS630 family transposase [Phycisphaerales bacterium]
MRVFFMEEARFGQKGTLTNVWTQRGSRPTAVRQTRYEWAHLFAAVEPATGASSALIAPSLNTGIMNAFLRQLAKEELGPRDHAIVIMDQAGWHRSKELRVPDQITILLLPPYSPELNPVERVWAHMRSHHLANRAFADYEAIVDAGVDSWRSLTPELLRSICRCEYLEREE